MRHGTNMNNKSSLHMTHSYRDVIIIGALSASTVGAEFHWDPFSAFLRVAASIGEAESESQHSLYQRHWDSLSASTVEAESRGEAGNCRFVGTHFLPLLVRPPNKRGWKWVLPLIIPVARSACTAEAKYGVAIMSRLLKTVSLFCRISSL